MDFWEQEREKIELEQRHKLLEYRAQQLDGIWNSLQLVKVEMRDFETRVRDLNEDRTGLITQIKELQSSKDDFLDFTKNEMRNRALGQIIDHLELKDGRVFENAKVTSIDDGGVSIRHDHGTATLRFGSLSPDQQLRFGLMNEESANAAEALERQQAIAYDQWIDGESERIQAAQQETATRVANREKSRKLNFESFRTASTASTRPLAQPPRSVGSNIWPRYSRYHFRQSCNIFYYNQPTRSNPFYYQNSSAASNRILPAASGGRHPYPVVDPCPIKRMPKPDAP